MIPLSVPHLSGSEWVYVKECLDTGWVSSAGSFVDRFEREMARYTGASHAIACSSGTAALHIALLLGHVGPGDEVLVPTVTFVATVNAIRYAGAHPVFMDCDDSNCLDVEKTLEFLDKETESRDGHMRNRRTGARIAAVLPVHVFGNAAALEPLAAFCQERGLVMIEDAAESLGTVYSAGTLKGKHTGTVGTIGCLSFNGNKIITTGGGGMLLTHDPKLAARARYLTTQAKDDEVRFVHNEVGYNYRLTNLQAALGVAQLEQMPRFLQIKADHYNAYVRGLQDVEGLKVAPVPSFATNNHWLCSVRVEPEKYGCDREALMNRLQQKGIQTRPLWHLNHLQKPYARFQTYRIERALELWRTTLNVPSSVGLTSADRDLVIAELRQNA